MGITSILAYMILTLSIVYAFIYPSVTNLSNLFNERQKYKDALGVVNNIEDKKNELLTEFNNISAADKKDIETILPNSLDFVNLISQIDAVAASHGISIDKISSRETGSSVGESVEKAQSARPYQSSIIGFSLVAPYDKFRDFIDDLGKSLRTLDIRSVELKTQENGAYSYDVTFETYWLKPLQ